MHLSVYLPLAFSALFGLAAPVLSRRQPPAAATWLLSVGSLMAAVGSTISLALLALTLVGQTPMLAARGHWSHTALRHTDPVATPIAAAALIALLVLTPLVLLVAARRLTALRAAYQLSAALPASTGELAVTDHPGPQAYAVPGRPGRIVVTSGLLRSLNADERRAVLAHERAHLTYRHHLHHTIARLAAAANPLLCRIPAAVALSTERWADEQAAATSSRDAVAAALTRTVVGASLLATPGIVLAAATGEVTTRVRALLMPAPRPTPWRIAVLVALLIATAVAVFEAATDTKHLFELAEYAYSTGHH